MPFSVNELSNKIDLPSTLLRAQALFRRFQRTVEAIDKKDNFPIPTIRQRKPADSKVPASPRPTSSGNATGADARTSGHTKASNSSEQAVTPETMKKRIISPELRALLSRKVETLDKKEVAEHGGGVGTTPVRTVRDV